MQLGYKDIFQRLPYYFRYRSNHFARIVFHLRTLESSQAPKMSISILFISIWNLEINNEDSILLCVGNMISYYFFEDCTFSLLSLLKDHYEYSKPSFHPQAHHHIQIATDWSLVGIYSWMLIPFCFLSSFSNSFDFSCEKKKQMSYRMISLNPCSLDMTGIG